MVLVFTPLVIGKEKEEEEDKEYSILLILVSKQVLKSKLDYYYYLN
jgi:hypothetical protein